MEDDSDKHIFKGTSVNSSKSISDSVSSHLYEKNDRTHCEEGQRADQVNEDENKPAETDGQTGVVDQTWVKHDLMLEPGGRLSSSLVLPSPSQEKSLRHPEEDNMSMTFTNMAALESSAKKEPEENQGRPDTRIGGVKMTAVQPKPKPNPLTPP
ncbi:unnamed protein product [Somion occarium]|uniref:Uncharacterized protein n=1 Tax=Somion occarium TaxID=3059160 RepID=A0ABP1DJM8_9APHY